ncbi:hypothetical protein F383_12136 [Gossypium arboreum]|uniref:Uncharacterized protein n=1 Tax=Gossypium arboreum TaxID=29729 RepID=A0A0B0NEU5_GOSAR|nr:hypothetical protein F383_12136 [Gossypium arboreum]
MACIGWIILLKCCILVYV